MSSIAVGDFDGDGNLDLAVAGNTLNPDPIQIYLGNGNGTFTAGAAYPTQSYLNSSLQVADFNHDGKLDLVEAGDGEGNDGEGVNVLLGNGDGSFQAPVFYPVQGPVQSAVVGDLTGNGNPDVVVVTQASPDAVYILMGNGDGTLQSPLAYPVGTLPTTVALANLIPAGPTDLVVNNSRGTNTFTVLLQSAGSVHFQVTAPAAPPANQPFTVTVTALNTKGQVDTNYRGVIEFSSSDPSAVLPGSSSLVNGQGTFDVTLSTPGSQAIVVNDSADPLATGSATGIDIPAVTTHFSVMLPSSVTAGAPCNLTVTALDVLNQPVTNYSGTVEFSCTDVQAILPGTYTFVPGDAGQHVFTVIFKTAVDQSLAATDTVNAAIQGTAADIAVGPAAASYLVMSGQQPTTTAGFPQIITLTAMDPFGNIATEYSGTISFSSSDPQALLPSPYTFVHAPMQAVTISA